MARVTLRCIEDDKVLLEAPVNVDFTPDRKKVMDNMKCILANHKVRVTVRE